MLQLSLNYVLPTQYKFTTMRFFFFLLSLLSTIALVLLLNTAMLTPVPLGKLLSPQQGLWQNAAQNETPKNLQISSGALGGKVDVFFDERLVPHVFAEQEQDLYFVQGYLHAKYRLWQMDFQASAAAGELSALVGDVALQRDREFRRLGMRYAAEKAVVEMEKDADTKAACDAYTAGVNEYISNLSDAALPVEYKLLGYKPKPWSNLKNAYFLKYMSYDLASAADDFEMTNAKSFFTKEQFDLLYPAIQDSLDPIIPASEPFIKDSIKPNIPATADSNYFNNKDVVLNEQMQPHRENGSNNWAVAGSKTSSGSPILCNDPHLGLNLPSLWYEMQLSCPEFNAYGATFPGSQSIIIGFNDSCAFGFTNGGRDVRDYYAIEFTNADRSSYLYNGTNLPTKWRIDTIKIKGKADFIDSVAYVILGTDEMPVMYDKNFTGNKTNGQGSYAVRWKAHDAGNELKVFYELNRAKNYDDYTTASKWLLTPGQNIVFACKNGDIALRTQGAWPAKWQGQGDFIMPGTDSSYLWQGMIPQNEVPYQYNPERGFVSSANQKPVSENYPYYLGRVYPEYRGITINKLLKGMSNITVQDMMKLQCNNYDGLAGMVLPALINQINAEGLNASQKKIYDTLSQWDMQNDGLATGPTIFKVFWKNFYASVFDDEFKGASMPLKKPLESTLVEMVLRPDASILYDNIETELIESLEQNVSVAFAKTVDTVLALQAQNQLQWYKYNAVRVQHLARLPAYSRDNFIANGGSNSINANHGLHGPSWRMIVSLTPQTEAYGIFPGGQSGNPASPFYDSFINDWAAEKYYKLWVMKKTEATDPRIIADMHFSKK